MIQRKSKLFVFGVCAFVVAALALIRFGDSSREASVSAHSTSSDKSAPSRLDPPLLLQLAPRSCQASSNYHHALKCYWYFTDEAPNKGFELPVVVYKSNGTSPREDPLVYISGGPGVGGSTLSDSLSYWDEWLVEANINRDFILVDLRGVQGGKPTLSCEKYDVMSKKLIQKNLTFSQEYEVLNPIINKCLSDLSRTFKNGLHDFNSLKNAQDLAGVLSALGYASWNYLGVSYGTRVALVAALTQPQVNSLILDSPYPLGRGQLSEVPALWGNALENFFLAQDNPPTSNLKAQFYSVKARLKAKPLMVAVEDWDAGQDVIWVLNDQRFVAAVYSSLYSSESLPDVVTFIREMAKVGAPKDTYILELFYNQAFDSSFNSMLYFATECNDNTLVSEADFNSALNNTAGVADVFDAEWRWDVCRNPLFKSGQLPPMEKLDIPVLVAVGGYDPITPPEYGRQLMPWLNKGYGLLQPKKSHAEFYSSECGQSLIPQFLARQVNMTPFVWQKQLKTAACNKSVSF